MVPSAGEKPIEQKHNPAFFRRSLIPLRWFWASLCAFVACTRTIPGINAFGGERLTAWPADSPIGHMAFDYMWEQVREQSPPFRHHTVGTTHSHKTASLSSKK